MLYYYSKYDWMCVCCIITVSVTGCVYVVLLQCVTVCVICCIITVSMTGCVYVVLLQ